MQWIIFLEKKPAISDKVIPKLWKSMRTRFQADEKNKQELNTNALTKPQGWYGYNHHETLQPFL